MRSGGAILPPLPNKGYLSDTCAIPHENKANWVRYPLCDTIRKGMARSVGVFRTGQLSSRDFGQVRDFRGSRLEAAPVKSQCFDRQVRVQFFSGIGSNGSDGCAFRCLHGSEAILLIALPSISSNKEDVASLSD